MSDRRYSKVAHDLPPRASPVSGLSETYYAVRAVYDQFHTEGFQSYVFSRRHRSTLHAVIIPYAQ